MKASIVVMSHLSDAQELMNDSGNREANMHIDFTKFIIIKCNNDLSQEIDGDEMWKEFMILAFYGS